MRRTTLIQRWVNDSMLSQRSVSNGLVCLLLRLMILLDIKIFLLYTWKKGPNILNCLPYHIYPGHECVENSTGHDCIVSVQVTDQYCQLAVLIVIMVTCNDSKYHKTIESFINFSLLLLFTGVWNREKLSLRMRVWINNIWSILYMCVYILWQSFFYFIDKISNLLWFS